MEKKNNPIGFTDIHEHIIFDIDDGPKTKQHSLEMLKKASADGITKIIATSHAIPCTLPYLSEKYFNNLAELNTLSKENNLDIKLYSGCELFYSETAIRFLAEKRVPTLAGTRFVLLEFWEDVERKEILNGVNKIQNLGYIPVIAHCERYKILSNKPKEFIKIRQDLQMRAQVNAGSILKKQNRHVSKAIDLWLDSATVDYIATDAHNTSSRPHCLHLAYEKIVIEKGEKLANTLFFQNPHEIVD